MARPAFNKKTTPFTSKLELRLKEEQCYIWSRVVYCAEICKLRIQIRNSWKVLKCGAGKGCRRSAGLIV